MEELAGTFGADTLILPCDVTKDDEIAGVFKAVGDKFGKLHLLLHSVAFAPKDALEGEFVNTSREAFRIAHDVSAYSLVALARAAVRHYFFPFNCSRSLSISSDICKMRSRFVFPPCAAILVFLPSLWQGWNRYQEIS